MKKIKNKKIESNLVRLLAVFLFILFGVGLVNAACIIGISVEGSVSGEVISKCEKSGELKESYILADTGGKVHSFGGIADACEERCGRVIMSWNGLEYIMSGNNQESWDARTFVHRIKINFESGDLPVEVGTGSFYSNFEEEVIPEPKILESSEDEEIYEEGASEIDWSLVLILLLVGLLITVFSRKIYLKAKLFKAFKSNTLEVNGDEN